MAEGGGALSLLCLAAGSGLPLFCRPPRPQLPFSVIGSLNGVHMFGAGAGVGLRGAETPRARLAWGGYGQSITLIALSSAPSASGPALSRLLDSAFGAMTSTDQLAQTSGPLSPPVPFPAFPVLPVHPSAPSSAPSPSQCPLQCSQSIPLPPPGLPVHPTAPSSAPSPPQCLLQCSQSIPVPPKLLPSAPSPPQCPPLPHAPPTPPPQCSQSIPVPQVLVLGLDELVPIRNMERLKRDLRSCFGLIDALLGAAGGGLGLGPPICPLPPGPPRDALQERLEAFAAAAQTGLGCLLGGGGGRVLLATPPWWGLPPPDTALLGGLLGGGGAAPPGPTARDLPVYLPHSSPTVPHRLLLLELVPGVGVALLCGPRPPLQLLHTQLVPQFWGPVLEQLRGCARPPPPPLPRGVLAYLLIHRQQGRTQSGIVTGGGQDEALPPQHRGAALCHLYTLLAPQLCPEEGGPPGPPPGAALCYAALPTHTGCALLRPGAALLLLLPPRAPRRRLRPLALQVLRALRPP